MGLYIIFGTPGSGKTTYGSKIVYRNLRNGIPTLCNFKVKGGFLYDFVSDVGVYEMSFCDLVFDEAAVFANSRNFKNFGQNKINWFSLYRHHRVRDIYIFSQSYENMDITLRRLANSIFTINRLWWFPWLIVLKEVTYKVGPNEQTQKMEDLYWYSSILRNKYCWMPKYWPMFDSWECEPLPYKEWKMYGFDVPFDDNSGLKKLSKQILKKNKKLQAGSSVADPDEAAENKSKLSILIDNFLINIGKRFS